MVAPGRAQGAKWRRVDFTVPRSGPSTLRLSWTGAADMRFTVFNSATGQKLGENLSAANPKSLTPPPLSGRPNVVVITLDDMRADMVQHLPKLRQWMVDGGTTFRNGHVSTPSCCPSRASLMSGRYVHNNGQFQ